MPACPNKEVDFLFVDVIARPWFLFYDSALILHCNPPADGRGLLRRASIMTDGLGLDSPEAPGTGTLSLTGPRRLGVHSRSERQEGRGAGRVHIFAYREYMCTMRTHARVHMYVCYTDAFTHVHAHAATVYSMPQTEAHAPP